MHYAHFSRIQKYRVGITTEYYLDRLKQSGVTLERLLSDHGYALFRLPMDNQPLSPPQSPEVFTGNEHKYCTVNMKHIGPFPGSSPCQK